MANPSFRSLGGRVTGHADFPRSPLYSPSVKQTIICYFLRISNSAITFHDDRHPLKHLGAVVELALPGLSVVPIVVLRSSGGLVIVLSIVALLRACNNHFVRTILDKTLSFKKCVQGLHSPTHCIRLYDAHQIVRTSTNIQSSRVSLGLCAPTWMYVNARPPTSCRRALTGVLAQPCV